MDWALIVKRLRDELILLQVEFSKLVEVSFATANRWENGRHIPTIKQRRLIKELCIKNKVKFVER